MNTKNPLRLLAMLFAVSGLVIFSGCGDDEEPAPTESILEIIQGNPDYSEFLAFHTLFASSLPALDGTSDYTVFVPNNNAFDNLRAVLGIEDLSTVNNEVIAGVMAFHFVSGTVLEADLGTSQATTFPNESIAFNDDGTILTGGSNTAVTFGTTDQKATNGVIHEVNTILIPPTVFGSIATHLGKVSQAIFLGNSFTMLIPAIAKADEFAAAAGVPSITDIISGETVFSMFSPTNDTFLAGGITSDTYDGQTWYAIFANHVVFDDGNADDANNTIDAEELVTGATFTTALAFPTGGNGMLTIFNNTDLVPASNGLGIFIDSNFDVDVTLADGGASLTNLDAEVALPNAFEGSNGVLHVIAGVLAPPAPE